MKAASFDNGLARRIYTELQGNDNSKAAALARIFGVYEDIKHSQDQGPYRSGDIISIIGTLVEAKRLRALPQSENIIGEYILMPESNYVEGLHRVQAICEAEKDLIHPKFKCDNGMLVYRPLSMKENIEARVNDYETLYNPDGSERNIRDRSKLFEWLFSSSCIAHKNGTTKCKIIPICKEIIDISENSENFTFKYVSEGGAYLPIDYEDLDFDEFDCSKLRFKWKLTFGDVLQHPGWLAIVENDNCLLKAYAEIVFSITGNKAMEFEMVCNTDIDILNPLGILDIRGNCSNICFHGQGSFIRVASPQHSTLEMKTP